MLDFLFIVEKGILNIELLKMFLFVWVVSILLFKNGASVTKVLLTVIVAYSILMTVIK